MLKRCELFEVCPVPVLENHKEYGYSSPVVILQKSIDEQFEVFVSEVFTNAHYGPDGIGCFSTCLINVVCQC